MSDEHEIIYNEKEIVVIGDYVEGERGQYSLSDGSPGYPDSPPEFYIDKILDLHGIDITDQYTAEDFNEIANKILEGYE